MRRAERPVSAELVAFHRKEQMQRLVNFFTRKASSAESSPPPIGNAQDPR